MFKKNVIPPSDEKIVLDLIMHGLDCAKKAGLKIKIRLVLTEEGKIDTGNSLITIPTYAEMFEAHLLGKSMIYPYNPYDVKNLANPFYGIPIKEPEVHHYGVATPQKYRLPKDAYVWIIDGKPYSMLTGQEVLQFTPLEEVKGV